MNTNPASLAAAALLVVMHRSLLLAFSIRKQAWFLPGGKTSFLHFNMHVNAPAFGEQNGVQMEQHPVIGVLMVMEQLKKDGYL